MGFTDTQVRQLSARLDGKHVRQRWQDGKQFAYLEGWHVIAEANRIFGFAAWDRETVKTTCVWQGYDGPTATCAYSAKVRIRVRSAEEVIVREGHGTGTGRGETSGQAHEQALKEAETDATKRAFMTFGNAFGLALYDPEQKQVKQPRRRGRGKDRETAALAWPLFASTGRVIASYAEPTDFCSAFRQWLEAADTLEELNGFWSQNRVTIDLLRRKRPELTTKAGLHYAELLGRLAERKVRSLAAEEAAGTPRDKPEAQAPQDKPADHPPAPGGKTAAAPSESSPEVKSPEPASRRPTSPSKSAPSSTKARPPAAASKETAEGGPIDKSRLLLPAPKRLRRPDHLRYVASLSCAICGRRPAQAHHLTFAEPRALGRKTGDDWTVPLCAAHHRSLHAAGSEQAWWRTHEIDPIKLAEVLWGKRSSTE